MISDYLEIGHMNAITGAELCQTLGISTRDLMQKVEQERRAGVPICSRTGKNPGYYLAANKEELKAYCNSMYRRGGNLFKTRRALLQSIENLPD